MSQSSKIALLKEILESAESSLRSAKQILNEIIGKDFNLPNNRLAEKAAAGAATSKKSSEGHIIEGVFDGQNMIGPDSKMYTVPANYASKSKLVPGDVLKLTISDEGSFIYKQIGPIERKKIVGTLTYDDGQYRVIATGKSYKVLLASVTYFKAEIGDRVTIIIPEADDTEWAAIENVLPRLDEDALEESLDL